MRCRSTTAHPLVTATLPARRRRYQQLPLALTPVPWCPVRLFLIIIVIAGSASWSSVISHQSSLPPRLIGAISINADRQTDRHTDSSSPPRTSSFSIPVHETTTATVLSIPFERVTNATSSSPVSRTSSVYLSIYLSVTQSVSHSPLVAPPGGLPFPRTLVSRAFLVTEYIGRAFHCYICAGLKFVTRSRTFLDMI